LSGVPLLMYSSGMEAPNEFQPLMDEIFREKVLRARAQKETGQYVSGLDLYVVALARMRGGIRTQFPHFNPDQVETELRRRLARVRQVQEHGYFRNTTAA
jgi:hypothetical protein